MPWPSTDRRIQHPRRVVTAKPIAFLARPRPLRSELNWLAPSRSMLSPPESLNLGRT
jgi:hypothetical protein